MHWKVDYCMPEMHGSIEKSNNNNNIGGGEGGHMLERDVHTDVGYAHASFPRLEVVFWPLSTRLGGGGERGEGDGIDNDGNGASTIRKGDELENFSKPLD